ncbi:SufE family protein [Shewanella yunxiaonensis]|uniref:SufE family protein n=1 Tax=Shewanella yunxiaonensis TaxID=2829809 RepID=A0ABX7YVJ4_9GAMM|nr:SufE family protein [Shewanella yunxiaonensis]QUN06518.1 SufE family protein [Shewanella yunxiaonensis]
MNGPDNRLFEAYRDCLPQLQHAVATVHEASNWQDKYRLLMQVGKLLPELPAEWQQDSARVRGCESAAWLYHQTRDGQHLYVAFSDARIVKGLIALLLAAVNNRSADEIMTFSAEHYFASLGLAGQLSPSRTNGLYALATTMKNLIG